MTHPGMIVRRLNFTPAAMAKNRHCAAPRPPHISYVDQGERPARVASPPSWADAAFAPSRVAADLCQVDESAIRQWAIEGKVRTTKVRGKLIFRMDDVLKARDDATWSSETAELAGPAASHELSSGTFGASQGGLVRHLCGRYRTHVS